MCTRLTPQHSFTPATRYSGGKRGFAHHPRTFHVKQTHNTLSTDLFGEISKSLDIIEECLHQADAHNFHTHLTGADHVNLRNMYKAVSQSPSFSRECRDLALRLIGELDQLELQF